MARNKGEGKDQKPMVVLRYQLQHDSKIQEGIVMIYFHGIPGSELIHG